MGTPRSENGNPPVGEDGKPLPKPKSVPSGKTTYIGIRESSLQLLTVHSAVQVMVQDHRTEFATLELEPLLESEERDPYMVPRAIIDGMKVYFKAARPYFVMHELKPMTRRNEDGDDEEFQRTRQVRRCYTVTTDLGKALRTVVTELFFVNSLGNCDFRVRRIRKQATDAITEKLASPAILHLERKLAIMLPLPTKPTTPLETLEPIVKRILETSAHPDLEETTIRRTTRARLDTQRHVRATIKTKLFLAQYEQQLTETNVEDKLHTAYARFSWAKDEASTKKGTKKAKKPPAKTPSSKTPSSKKKPAPPKKDFLKVNIRFTIFYCYFET